MRALKEVMATSMTTDFDAFLQKKVLKSYCCLGCLKEVEVARFVIPAGPNKGKVSESTSGCDCELIIQVQEQRKLARIARLQKIFEENSLINDALKKACFDNFDPSEFYSKFKQAKKYADDFNLDKPTNLLFQGSYGTGKSHLAVSIAKKIKEKGYSSIFISSPKLLTKIRNTYNKMSEHSEEQIIDAIIHADLVIFDDIGAEGEISGWGMQKLFEVIDSRSGKHNIYTTNLKSKEFEANRDLQRIFSRMMMNTELLIMNGTDYRRKRFKKED